MNAHHPGWGGACRSQAGWECGAIPLIDTIFRLELLPDESRRKLVMLLLELVNRHLCFNECVVSELTVLLRAASAVSLAI